MNKRGVTLIELLIVVGVISIVAAVGGDILLTVIRAYKKAQVLGTVEQNGSLVSTLLGNNLRNSSTIKYYESEDNFLEVGEDETIGSNYIKITSSQGVSSTIQFVEGDASGNPCRNGRIEVDGNPITDTNVVSGANVVRKGSSSVFAIYNPIEGSPVVTVLFDVKEACQSPVTAMAEFNNTVTLRGSYGN